MASIPSTETSYTIGGLEEATEYTITVTLFRDGGSDEDSVVATTSPAGRNYFLLVILILRKTSCLPAPSAPPTSVSTSDVTSSSITVQWGAVDCIHRNGDITGYSVRYGVQGSAEGDRTVVMASGDSSGGMDMISGLTPSTTYTIEVAAVNSAGTGVYSDAITELTLGMYIHILHT